jgi:hypothetical protein
MPKSAFWTAAFAIIFFFLSCNETSTTPSEPAKPVLTASENTLTIARNYSKSISVTGGKGSYRVKSISDSTIVKVSFYPSNQTSTQFSQTVSFSGEKVGTTKIVIQDSAKTAEVEITVTVAVMVSSPSSVTVKTQQTKYIYISGGTYPYSIDQSPNASVATVFINGSSLEVTGFSPGTTSVTIRDNATPANKLTIPINVILPPSFTTSGKISFSSTKGNFATEGIYASNNANDLPSNDAGAGGFVSKYSSIGNFGRVIGYKKKTSTTMDIVMFIFYKDAFTAGTLSLDSAASNMPRETGTVIFGFDLLLNGFSNPIYSSFSGNLTFSTFNEQKAEGSFSGKAGLTSQQGKLIPGGDVTISQGLFSVPLIVEEGSFTSAAMDERSIFDQIERSAKPYIEKAKKRMESAGKR